MSTDWWDYALCAEVGGDLFFPERGGSGTKAKRICARCEVTQECGRWALDNDIRIGVWGGMSERERRKIRRAERAGSRS